MYCVNIIKELVLKLQIINLGSWCEQSSRSLFIDTCSTLDTGLVLDAQTFGDVIPSYQKCADTATVMGVGHQSLGRMEGGKCVMEDGTAAAY